MLEFAVAACERSSWLRSFIWEIPKEKISRLSPIRQWKERGLVTQVLDDSFGPGLNVELSINRFQMFPDGLVADT